MNQINITDTVRSMLSPRAVETLSVFLETVIDRCSIDGKPLSTWAIHPNRKSIINTQIIDTDRPDAEGLPELIIVTLSCNLPEGGIIATTVPGEHSFLEVWDGKLWTVGDLAMRNPETFYLLEFLVSTDTRHRVNARLRTEDPDQWRVTQDYVRRRIDQYCCGIELIATVCDGVGVLLPRHHQHNPANGTPIELRAVSRGRTRKDHSMKEHTFSEGDLAAANETYLEATGAALLRALRSAIEFALAEPTFFPAPLDEDTGEFAPVPNDGPRIRVRSLAAKAMRHPSASRLLASCGWTDDTCDGDLQTMLDYLSPA